MLCSATTHKRDEPATDQQRHEMVYSNTHL